MKAIPMKTKHNLLLAGMFLAATSSALATVRYVDGNSAYPTPPYTNWATAATIIQQAVDAAVSGDEIVVTNGTYATGGRAVGTNVLVNRVAVDKPLTVRSVNGPQVTVIQGYQVPGTTNGDGAIRCVYLADGASLSGFTLTNGATRSVLGDWPYPDSSGGGLWCESEAAVVYNCVLAGNSAYEQGGGAYCGLLNYCTLTGNSATYGGGVASDRLQACALINCWLDRNSASEGGGGAFNSTLNNCTLIDNAADFGGGTLSGTLNNCALLANGARQGGGASESTLNNCTLTGNSASHAGGGAYGCTLSNCIVYFNSDPLGGNYDASSALNYCCTMPMPPNGFGNISADPQLASASHVSANSPCRGGGNIVCATGTDIDGEAWANPPSIGCDENHAAALTGPLSVSIGAAYTNVVMGLALDLTAWIEGRPTASVWEFGDGMVLSNRPYATHVWAAPGEYAVVLRAYNESYPAGVSATVTIHVLAQPVYYVAGDSSNPMPPYTSWATAATNIQDAVDAADAGSLPPGSVLVLVTNGVYATGGRVAVGTTVNRVAVDKPLAVRSVNGPQFTIIQGYQVPGTTIGDGAIRCVYLTNSASLSGFTLTNGATRVWAFGIGDSDLIGGGVWCESTSAVVSNCVLAGNSAQDGGGAYGGTLNNCTLTDNWAHYTGGGAYGATLNNCTLTGNSSLVGGGACNGTLNNCTVTANSASWYGGGAAAWEWGFCILRNCTVAGNSAIYGGGACYGTLNNCTLTGNSAQFEGGGAYRGTLNNCIVYFNTARTNANYASEYGILNYCCTTPMPTYGVGNMALDPQLASGSHLSASSPCRAAASDDYATGTDIDGEAWASPPLHRL
jgi:hypothetical protein